MERMYRCSSHDSVREYRSKSDETKIYHTRIDGCDCPGYKFNGTCWHFDDFKAKECLWDQLIDGGDVVIAEVPHVGDVPTCPECQKPVEAYTVDV